MELLHEGRVIAEVVSTDYEITSRKKVQITACDKILNVEVVETSKNDTIIIFKGMHEMLCFEGHIVFLFGVEIYKIRKQHMTKEITYALMFKTEDYEKYIQKIMKNSLN